MLWIITRIFEQYLYRNNRNKLAVDSKLNTLSSASKTVARAAARRPSIELKTKRQQQETWLKLRKFKVQLVASSSCQLLLMLSLLLLHFWMAFRIGLLTFHTGRGNSRKRRLKKRLISEDFHAFFVQPQKFTHRQETASPITWSILSKAYPIGNEKDAKSPAKASLEFLTLTLLQNCKCQTVVASGIPMRTVVLNHIIILYKFFISIRIISVMILFFVSDFFCNQLFAQLPSAFTHCATFGVSVAADLLKWLESLSLFGARFGPNAKCDAADGETTLD